MCIVGGVLIAAPLLHSILFATGYALKKSGWLWRETFVKMVLTCYIHLQFYKDIQAVQLPRLACVPRGPIVKRIVNLMT